MIKGNKGIRLVALIDMHDAYEKKPIGTVDYTDWYGALYYKIIPFENGNKTEYLLLGWDGGTAGSNYKILDVLVLGKKSVRFGSPVLFQIISYKNELYLNTPMQQ